MYPQQLFALLVAVDKYHPSNKSVTHLAGCVHDINATAALLNKYYKSLKPNIVMLKNEEATYQNVIEQFQQHLIGNASNHATLLFWFSGHGSRQDTDPTFREVSFSKKDETLVCYDSRAVTNHKMWGKDLADKELAVLIALAAQKGAEVVTVFDCCHSGSITREDTEDCQARELDDRKLEDEIGPPQYNYLNGYYQKHQLSTVPEGRHLALSACQYNETAKEINIDGQRRGVFSFHLQEVIAKTPGITYAQLSNQVNGRISHYNFNSHQTPQFEPINRFDAHRSFLTTQKPMIQRKRYEVYYDREKQHWKIRLGAAHGLPQTTHQASFAIFEEATIGLEPLGQALVNKVGMVESYLLPEGKSNYLTPGNIYWGEFLSIPQSPLYLSLDADKNALQSIQNGIVKRGWLHFGFDNFLGQEFLLAIKNGHWQLFKNGKKIPVDFLNYQDLINKLDQLGRWHLLWNNQNKYTRLKTNDFGFTFKNHLQDIQVTESTEKCVLRSTPDATGVCTVPYQILVQNNTYQELYFTLLYFSPKYGIQVLQNQPLPARCEPTIMDNKSLKLPADDIEFVYRFQLLVSTAKIDVQFFPQSDIDQYSVRNLVEDKEAQEDWRTISLEIALQKA